MALDVCGQVLQYLNLAAAALLLGRLMTSRLTRSYPFLTAYFAADVMTSVAGIYFSHSRAVFLYVYVVDRVLRLGLGSLLILELYRLSLEGRPALAKFGQRAAGWCMALLVSVAAAGLYLGPAVPAGRRPLVHYLLTFERTMDSVLAAALIVLALFLAWFPVRIRRNSAINIGAFTAYFLAHWAATLAANVWYASTREFNVALMGFSLACFFVWIAMLRPAGEARSVVTGSLWDETRMNRLTGQLDALNTRLMRLP